MAGASVKIGVDVTQFKQGMQQAQQSAKTLSAQLKANEAQFKATGDKEQYLADKAKLLKAQLDAQKTAAANAQKALEAMRNSGVSETSSEYQKLQMQLANATAAMYDAQGALNGLTSSEQQAAGGAAELVTNLNDIGKKISVDQVITGLDRVTTSMQKAAGKAIELGRELLNAISDTASYADDIATSASRLSMGSEEYQRLKGVLDTVGDMTVAEWTKTKQKVLTMINKPTEDQATYLSLLGINTHEIQQGKLGPVQGAARDMEDVLWDIGTELRRRVENGDLTQDMAETYAMAFFGRGYGSLNNIFSMGKDAFTALLNDQTVASDEAVKSSAEYNDTLIKLQNTIGALKIEMLGAIAPALTQGAEALNTLFQGINEYMKTEDGNRLMSGLGDAILKIVNNIGELDPGTVVQTISDALGGVVTSLDWIAKNWGTVKNGLYAIATGFGLMKIATVGLNISKIVSGLKGLGTGGTGTGTGTGTGAGTSVTEILNATTANITTGRTTTEHVSTMYVSSMITGPGTQPGGGNNGGSGNGGIPYVDPNTRFLPGTGTGGGSGLNGYVPILLPNGNQLKQLLIPENGTQNLAAASSAPKITQGQVTQLLTDGGAGTQGTQIIYGEIPSTGMVINAANGKIIPGDAFEQFAATHPVGNKIVDTLTTPYALAALGVMSAIPVAANAASAYKTNKAIEEAYGKDAADAGWQEQVYMMMGKDPDTANEYAKQSNERSKKAMERNGLGALTWIYDLDMDSGFNKTINAIGDFVSGVGKVSETSIGMLNDLLFDPRNNEEYERSSEEAELAADALRAAIELGKDQVNQFATGVVADVIGAVADMAAAASDAAATLSAIASGGGRRYGGGRSLWMRGGNGFITTQEKANGLFSVPWDGYPAILHKGERVLTAREAKTYNANSHLYVDHMYMNGDLDAERLADVLATRNSRVMRGFGS